MTPAAPSCPIHVRPVAHSDFPAWQTLWLGYNTFYGRSGETALPHAITLTTWSRLFDAYEPMHALVAEHEGPSCYLEDLFTSVDVRGQGVGRKLVEAVYAAAQRAGAPQVYWHTHETNATAMRLYDQVATQSGFLHYYHSFPSIPG